MGLIFRIIIVARIPANFSAAIQTKIADQLLLKADRQT